jgi:hypothetical protein
MAYKMKNRLMGILSSRQLILRRATRGDFSSGRVISDIQGLRHHRDLGQVFTVVGRRNKLGPLGARHSGHSSLKPFSTWQVPNAQVISVNETSTLLRKMYRTARRKTTCQIMQRKRWEEYSALATGCLTGRSIGRDTRSGGGLRQPFIFSNVLWRSRVRR